ncbi:IS30 family transposase [Spiroplasma endosymbiont of Polydrusus pterygomalis]|uniref:IS30 family transposase n=2 Tax=Spiroplasma endosymbiont of Polydrusus pterygomalis TaxID=3139327 RepID=UPI003CCAF7BC
MGYKHLGIDERIYIENQLKFKIKISEIAKNLNRSISTIIREVNINKDNNHYFSLIAQNKAENRKQSHIYFHKFKNRELVKYVQQKLLLGWSPEQIYGRIKNFHKEWIISFKTIYNWIYSGLLEKVTNKNLRRKGKKRKYQENRGKFNGKSIKERNANVNNRVTLGHWEGDTVVSSRGKSKSCLITLVERTSRFTLAILVENRTTKVINENISHYLSILPNNLVKTITFDRGKEFANWQQLEKNLNVKIYFANAYSPWQRGTNENSNGLIREKFPKKFNFSNTTKNAVHKFILSLNQRPRKILNYLSPIEYLVRKII